MEKNTNPWNELVTIKKNHPDAKTREIAGMYLSQLNTASGSILIGNEAANWANENKVPDFETGATSSAVNELILYTDNTRELAELREKMYCEWDEKGNPYGHEWTLADKMQKLLIQAIYSYQKQFPTEYKHICIFQSKKDVDKAAEYCQIYANRFEEWKKEKERNSK